MSNSTEPSSTAAGLTGGLPDSLSLKLEITVFGALALWNAIELIVLIFLTFAKYHGLYFWSLVVASCGIIPYTMGFLLKFFSVTTGNSKWLSVVLLTIGWYAMVTGQAVVLWSRLHLVTSRRGLLKWTGWMIVFCGIVLHLPTTVLTVGCNGDYHTSDFVRVFNVYEKTQMVGFFIQEIILSSIYILETIRILQTSVQPNTRKLMYQLFAINILIIAGDISLLIVEFLNLYVVETMWKPVLYSIKLKLEFAVLGKLVKFVGGSQSEQGRRKSTAFVTDHEQGRAVEDVSDFVDVTRIASDITHASPTIRKISRPYVNDSNTSRTQLCEGMVMGEHALDEYIELVESVDERLVFQKSFHPLSSITSIMEWVFEDPEHKNGRASIVPVPGTIPAKEIEDTVVVLEEQLLPTPPLTPDATVLEKKSRARLSIGEDHPIPAFRAGPLFPDASLTSKLTSSREALEIVDAV